MINALYSAAGGMLANLVKQDVIAQNIANVNTTGYKRRAVSCQTFSDVLSQTARVSASAQPEKTQTVSPIVPEPFIAEDSRQGAWEATGSALNFAIEGDGFFVVQTPSGSTLTRNGSFAINKAGELADLDGRPVMGEKGPIRMPDGEWSVDQDGTIMSGNTAVDKIKVVLPAKVTSSGTGGQSVAGTAFVPAQARLRQGSLEMSNVNVINEMVTMMTNLRGFEAGQRVIQSLDQSLEKLISAVNG